MTEWHKAQDLPKTIGFLNQKDAAGLPDSEVATLKKQATDFLDGDVASGFDGDAIEHGQRPLEKKNDGQSVVS